MAVSATTLSPELHLQLSEIDAGLRLLHGGTSRVFEVRCPDTPNSRYKPYTTAGLFNDFELAARAVLGLDYRKQPPAIYTVLNQIDERLLARSPNKLEEHPKATTSDGDVTSRVWLFLDFDPERPSGICASEDEKREATLAADKVRLWLDDDFHFPAPVEIDSGNGSYLLYRIDLPAGKTDDVVTKAEIETASSLVRNTLHAVDLFLRKVACITCAKVDLTCFNAARVARIPGTINRKGNFLADRPFRRCRIIAKPDELVVVSPELMKTVIEWHGAEAKGNGADDQASKNGEQIPTLKVEEWLGDRGVTVRAKKKDSKGRDCYQLAECPFDRSHGSNGEVVITQEANGKLGAKCWHNSCAGRGWTHFKEKIGRPVPHHYDPALKPKGKSKKRATPSPKNDPPKNAERDLACSLENTTDLGNAARFAIRHGIDVHFCHPWNSWLVWDGQRWRQDAAAHARRRAQDTVRRIYAEAVHAEKQEDREALAKWAAKSEESKHISALLKEASALEGIPVLPDQLNNDWWLFNCRNGTIDLRTGELHPHCRTDNITKLCQVEYNPAATCPRWEGFLYRVMDDNLELIGFLRRAVGYSLTGDTGEQVLFFLHGAGANGKTVFIRTVLDLLGEDYAMQAPQDLLMTKQGERHPTELADLFGKRLVACIETEGDRRLAESLIKQMTGGDRIRARRMRENFFEFPPTHKIWLAGNHKPVVRGTDDAIWRRILLIPFTVVIPEAERDKHLIHKLANDSSGILAWAVRGCLEWQKNGLGVPEKVRSATDVYRSSQDLLAQFIAERCRTAPQHRARASALYEAFKCWCIQCGEYAASQRRFGDAMTEHGFAKEVSNGTWYLGIELGPVG